MRAYGYPKQKRFIDEPKGVKVIYSPHGCDDYDWLTVKQAKALIESLKKAIQKAEGK